MSALNVLSVFYYGTTVTSSNWAIDFDEGGSEITAYLEISDYTLEGYADAIANAMNIAGTQTYSVVVNRSNRKLTISAALPFTLRANTGSHVATGFWTMAGFTTTSNKTGSNSYVSENGAGSEYRPQVILGNYLAIEDYVVKENAVVNQSSGGIIQTLQYGDGNRMQCNIRGASNITGTKNENFYENASGIAALRSFMAYLITKAKIEFMPDQSDRNTYYDLLLESTDKDQKGTQFSIKNMDGANNYFETGTLLFRKVIES
jgi:hypothetical protein